MSNRPRLEEVHSISFNLLQLLVWDIPINHYLAGGLEQERAEAQVAHFSNMMKEGLAKRVDYEWLVNDQAHDIGGEG
jgi:hypothetical protein